MRLDTTFTVYGSHDAAGSVRGLGRHRLNLCTVPHGHGACADWESTG